MGQDEVNKLNEQRLKDIADSPTFPSDNSFFRHYGMSKREYIATQCLAALITSRPQEIDTDYLSGVAIQYADKLIEKLHSK